MSNWKEKIRHEMIEYAINIVYLTLVFAAFTQYQRFVLAAYDIAYTNYWFALIQAVVLGKVIMIGGVFRLGQGMEDKPLIYPTLYKTVVFVVLVGVFKLIEHAIAGLWHGKALMSTFGDFSEKDILLLLANSLVVFAAFVPFFAVKELGRVFGGDKIFALFFQERSGKYPPV